MIMGAALMLLVAAFIEGFWSPSLGPAAGEVGRGGAAARAGARRTCSSPADRSSTRSRRVNLLEARVALRPRSMSDVLDLAGPFCMANRRLLAPLTFWVSVAGGLLGRSRAAQAAWPWCRCGWSWPATCCLRSGVYTRGGGRTALSRAHGRARVARARALRVASFLDILHRQVDAACSLLGALRGAHRALAHLRRALVLRQRGRAAGVGHALRQPRPQQSAGALSQPVPVSAWPWPAVRAVPVRDGGRSHRQRPGRHGLSDGPALRLAVVRRRLCLSRWPARCSRRPSWPAPAFLATSTCARARKAGTSSCASWRWPTPRRRTGESRRERAAPWLCCAFVP